MAAVAAAARPVPELGDRSFMPVLRAQALRALAKLRMGGLVATGPSARFVFPRVAGRFGFGKSWNKLVARNLLEQQALHQLTCYNSSSSSPVLPVLALVAFKRSSERCGEGGGNFGLILAQCTLLKLLRSLA